MAPRPIHYIFHNKYRWDDTFLQCVRLVGELQSMNPLDKVLDHLKKKTGLSKVDLEGLFLRGQGLYDEAKFCLALEEAMSGCCGSPQHQYVDGYGNVWSLQEEHEIYYPHHYQGRLKELPDASYVFCVGCGKKYNISLGEGQSPKKKEYPRAETKVAHNIWGLHQVGIQLDPEYREYLSKLLNTEGLWRQEYVEGEVVWEHYIIISDEPATEVGYNIKVQDGECSLFFRERHFTGSGVQATEERIAPEFFLEPYKYQGSSIFIY